MRAVRPAAWPPWVVVLVVSLVGFTVYARTLSYGFIWDDRAAVKANADVDPDKTPWSALFRNDFWGQPIHLPKSHKSFRPLTVATYRLNYMWSGFDPFGFHMVNVLLHSMASGLLAMVALSLTKSNLRSLVGGLLFAVHPTHVEDVACIVGRADVLSAVLSLAGVLCYIRCASLTDTRPGLFLAALALALLSTLSKEVGISTLAVYGAYDALVTSTGMPVATAAVQPGLVLGGRRSRGPAHLSVLGYIRRGVATLLYPPVTLRVLIVIATLLGFMRWRLSLHAGAALYPWTILENQYAIMAPGVVRTLSVLHTHVQYMWLLVWPVVLSFDHGFAGSVPVSGIWDVRNAATAALYVGAGAGVTWALRRNWSVGLLCVAWGLASFLPASNVVVFVGTEVAERLLYFPSMGFCIAVAYLLPSRLTGGVLQLPVAAAAADATDAAPCAGGTSDTRAEGASQLRRRAVPSADDPDVTAVDADDAGVARVVPPTPDVSAPRASVEAPMHARPGRGRWRAVLALVVVAALAVRTEVRNWDWVSEVVLFESALAIYPDSLKAQNNVALYLLNGSEEEMRRASRLLSRSVELYPDYKMAHYNLGLAYRGLGDRRLVKHLKEAATEPGALGKAMAYLGQFYIEEHLAGNLTDPETGEATLSLAQRYLERAPGYHCHLAIVYFGRGNVASELGEPAAALREFEQALLQAQGEAARGDVVTVDVDKIHNQRALAYQALGQDDMAIEEFIKANAFEETAATTSNLASVLLRHNRFEEAIQLQLRAVELEPTNALVLTNTGFAMERAGRLHDALEMYTRAHEVLPDHPQIATNLLNLKQALASRE